MSAVLPAGPMVGRTPEYPGRKIEAREVMLAFLSMPLGSLVGGAIAATVPAALAAVQEAGPHGLAEVHHACTTGTGNNVSAFGGRGAALPWHKTALGLVIDASGPICCHRAQAGDRRVVDPQTRAGHRWQLSDPRAPGQTF